MADYEAINQAWRRVKVAVRADEPEADMEAPAATMTNTGATFIASGAIFEGTLTLRGDFTIDTEFRGELETDGIVTVGSQGSVEGDIRAREVVIRGAVVGNVTAPRQLILEAGAKLHGDIETACLEIQKHALFRGTTSMTQPPESRRRPLASEAAVVTSPAPL